MALIKGITVTLYEKKQMGMDPFNRPVYEDVATQVDNVLVEPLNAQEIVSEMSITGKKAVFRLCIPKGDTHDWLNAKVSFFDQTFRTYGYPIEYIEENIPLDWNRKVMVERYG